MNYIPRALEPTVLAYSESFPVLLLTGARQVGKSTLLEHAAAQLNEPRTVVTLDNVNVRKLAKTEPELFLQRYKPPVLIDEIQYAPELLDFIKIDVDTHAHDANAKGRYWLTSSQPLHLIKNVSQTLAGRIGILELSPLSRAEIDQESTVPFLPSSSYFVERVDSTAKLNEAELYSALLAGGYPDMFAREPNARAAAFESYISTYLMRDIHEFTNVTDELKFHTFLEACAALTARPVNYTELARVAEITPKTAQAWLSLLVSSYLIKLVRPFTTNSLKRLSKQPLLHFCDTGLAAYLAGWPNAQALIRGASAGAFLETYTYNQIERSYKNVGRVPRLFYLRTNNKQEIDLVLEEENIAYPIEVKKAGSGRVADLKHFKLLQQAEKEVGLGTVACLCSDTLPINQKAWQFPIWAI